MKLTNLLFTIIIPTYNRVDQLRQCLLSIAELDYPNERFEVVIVDDGGTQNLDPCLADLDNRINVNLVQKSNGGPASARNEGALTASGQYLLFTDDDCELNPDFLTVLESSFQQYPECMIGGRTINRLTENLYSDTSQLIVDIVYRHYNEQQDRARFIASNNMAMPLQLFEQVGGFDLAFFSAASEDRELCSRWLDKGFEIVCDPGLLVYHSHCLTLGGFVRQHFAYGRGAYCFHKVQRSNGHGFFKREIGFHLNFKNWLLHPFRIQHHSALALAWLLVVWQVANACGFFWQAIIEFFGSKKEPSS